MINNIVKESQKLISQNLDKKITLDFIADTIGYSKFHLSKLFKKETGSTVFEYVTTQKLLFAAKDILVGNKIIDVAFNYGYETQNGFYKAFKKNFGYTPNMLHAMRLVKSLYSYEGGNTMNYRELYTEILNNITPKFTSDQIKLFKEAFDFTTRSHANQKRYSGEPYVIHPLNVSIILEKMELSFDVILLGLLHDTLMSESTTSFEDLKLKFGSDIADKVLKIKDISIDKKLLSANDDNFDEDVVMIKLADRLHNMKTLKHLSPTRWESKAKETLELFSPIAKRLGLTDLKLELDHLSIEHV